MGAGFHPPLINIRRQAKHGTSADFLCKHLVLMGMTEHLEYPMVAKIKVSWMASCNSVVAILIFCIFCFYTLWIEKGYLKKVTSSGVARLTMRHPVMDFQTGKLDQCDPLSLNCDTNYQGPKNLSYCAPKDTESVTCQGSTCACQYLDAFDIARTTSVEQRHLFLPSHIQEFDQDICTESTCSQRYTVSKQSSSYVADIESFTVTIEHAFVAEEVEMEKSMNSCAGFIYLCTKIGDKKVCGNVFIEGSGSEILNETTDGRRDGPERLQRLRDMWEDIDDETEEEPFKEYWRHHKAIDSNPLGDVVYVGNMLNALKVDLDASHPMGILHANNVTNKTLRELGFIMRLEYRYFNWREATWPNSLPPVYVINVHILDENEYNTMAMKELDRDTRRIQEKAGILISVHQGGNIGRADGRMCIYIFIELSVLLGLGKYLSLCCGLNLLSDPDAAQAFEHKLMPEVDDLTHDDVEQVSARESSPLISIGTIG